MDIEEFDNIHNLYLGRLNNAKEFKFFGIYKFQHGFEFEIVTLVFFSAIQIAINLYYIPLLVGTYIIWEYCILRIIKFDVAWNCAIHETIMLDEIREDPQILLINYPDDQLYITEGDREQIIMDCIISRDEPSIWKKITNYYPTLIYVMIFQFSFYGLIELIIYLYFN